MAMDQQETFNWLVNEKSRLETELASACADRDRWMTKAFDLAFEAARNNPALREQIERERKAGDAECRRARLRVSIAALKGNL